MVIQQPCACVCCTANPSSSLVVLVLCLIAPRTTPRPSTRTCHYTVLLLTRSEPTRRCLLFDMRGSKWEGRRTPPTAKDYMQVLARIETGDVYHRHSSAYDIRMALVPRHHVHTFEISSFHFQFIYILIQI